MPAFQRDPTVIANGYRPSANQGGGEQVRQAVEVGGSVNVGIDGTPPRVATMLIGGGAILVALKLAGWRFSVAN